MKLSELKPCGVCQGKLVPVWYVLRISQAMLKPHVANSVLGLAQHFGGIQKPGVLAIAEAMAPEANCVTIFGDVSPELMIEIHICQECVLLRKVDLGMLLEKQREVSKDAETVQTS